MFLLHTTSDRRIRKYLVLSIFLTILKKRKIFCQKENIISSVQDKSGWSVETQLTIHSEKRNPKHRSGQVFCLISEIVFLQVLQRELKNIYKWLILYQSKAISFYFGTEKIWNQNCDISVKTDKQNLTFWNFVCVNTQDLKSCKLVCLFSTEISVLISKCYSLPK